LGSADWFTRTESFVVFFDESVSGLDIGAPVKFNGVPIGEVSEIHIGFNFDENETQIPVVLTVDIKHLYDGLGFPRDKDFKTLCREAVGHGLRARLQYQSFLTGLLFVDLNYFPDHPVVENTKKSTFNCPIIPAMPSGAAEIWKMASGMIEQLGRINFAGLTQSLESILNQLNNQFKDLNFEALNHDFIETLKDIRLLVNLPEFRLMIDDFRVILKLLNDRFEPLSLQLDGTLKQAESAFEKVRGTALHMEEMLDPNSNFRYQAEESLKNIQEAAVAIRRLAELLEQNPSVLLTGKP
jgi:paraquat-inducible protein B